MNVIGRACTAAAIALTMHADALAEGVATIAAAPKGTRPCSIEAWTNNAGGEDIEVREAPRTEAQIIGRLPVTGSGADTAYSVRFAVTAFEAGWMKVDGASDRYNDAGARPVFAKQGWIVADAVRFQIQSARGFAEPDAGKARIVDLGDDWATDLGRIGRVLACDGEWALVDLVVERRRDGRGRLLELAELDRTRHRAWFRGLCGVEETTCDMKSVDQNP